MGTKQQLATKIKQLSDIRKDIRKSNPQQPESLQAYTPLGNLIKNLLVKQIKIKVLQKSSTPSKRKVKVRFEALISKLYLMLLMRKEKQR